MKKAYSMKCGGCGGTGKVLDPRKVGLAMRDHRESAGVSLRKVALKMGVSAPYLSDLERGNRNWKSIDIDNFNNAVACLYRSIK